MKGESSVPDYGMTKALSARAQSTYRKGPSKRGCEFNTRIDTSGCHGRRPNESMVIQIAKLEPWPAGYSDWWIGSVTLEAARDAGHSSG